MSGNGLLIIIACIVVIALAIKWWKFFLFVGVVLGLVGFFAIHNSGDRIVPQLPHPLRPDQHSFPQTGTFNALPDLTVKWVQRPAVPFPCDHPFTIVAHVSNRGEASAQNIEVILNDISSQYIDILKPNHSRSLQFHPRTPNFRPGTGNIQLDFVFRVDPTNLIREKNENNNRSETFSVICYK